MLRICNNGIKHLQQQCNKFLNKYIGWNIMGLIKGFRIIVYLWEKTFRIKQHDRNIQQQDRVFFSSKYSTNYEQRSRILWNLRRCLVLFSRMLSNIVNEFLCRLVYDTATRQCGLQYMLLLQDIVDYMILLVMLETGINDIAIKY